MKFKDINKIGFYANLKDTNRELIFEVFENTDIDWLKKEPEAKLLVDTWYYSHTDTDDIKHYDVNELLTILCRENPENNLEVAEITDVEYIVDDKYMQEDKPTYKQKYKQLEKCLDEIEEISNDDSLPNDSDVYEERDFYFNQLCKIDAVLQKIKEVKGNE